METVLQSIQMILEQKSDVRVHSYYTRTCQGTSEQSDER